MRALQGGTRIAFLAFFTSHIVFTLCVDLQALFQPFYPTPLQDLVANYASFVADPLMSPPFELWFQSIVFVEMIFQLPYFFIAVKMFADAQRKTYPRWFQMLSIVYGSHTATTLIPILPTIWFRDEEEAPMQLRLLLLLIYIPYFIFPAWIAGIAACDQIDLNPEKDKLK
jgi:EXPERA (EXPanded EBP superfamily)